ncbi:MAG: helix-turn-helix transcriptional regulator [Verrucomicrobia bacterium]|nr:helix-turn-helix transcriptional regulator [Verrucomicrobiota bacterium]
MEIQIAWAPVLPVEWTADDLLKACRSRSEACLNENGVAPKDAVCEECVRRELDATLRSGPTGWEFTCRLGRRQLWVAVRAADLTLGILVCSWSVPLGTEVGAEKTRSNSSPSGGSVAAEVRSIHEVGRCLAQVVRRVLETVCDEHQRSVEADQWRLAALAARAIPDQASSTVPTAIGPDALANPTVRALLERIHRDFAQPITLKSLALDLSKNESYLSAAFAACVGVTFKAYLTSLRIRHARGLLVGGKKSVEEVARACGYADPRRFSRTFKVQTGLSPQAFQRAVSSQTVAGEPLTLQRL